jgi:transposase InsO family protein
MPFWETCRMEERVLMLADYDLGVWNVSELCRRYGVCRDTFYEWRKRRERGDEDWFADRSHAVLHCPHRTSAASLKKIISLRSQFPDWGPRKLLARLQRQHPETVWPAASTIGDILKRAGKVTPRKNQRKPIDQRERPFVAVEAANDEWSVDFKGWFRTRDQQRIDPLTMSDNHSRYLIEIKITPQTIAGARPVFERVFQEHGLPIAIRCDNGGPFGSEGACGLTRLSAWWLRLGIEPRFIRPASPQENGRHERMHRTLKAQTTRPPASDAKEQQARFDAFRRHYNEERPHEALGQRPPAELYAPSARAMPDRLEEPWYDANHQVRRMRSSGDIKWKGDYIFISGALAGELVGIAELETGNHVVRFCDLDVGIIDLEGVFRRFAAPRTGLRKTAEHPTTSKLSGISPV